MGFDLIDYIVFIGYILLIVGIGLYVSRTKKGTEKTAQDYFLADRSLPWWAIGASLIAANISAEQFIGMSGSGFAIGLGIAAYEWLAAITLIFVAKFFLPVFIEKKIYTIPQFLEERFNKGVRTAFAILWLLVYVFVNLTSVSYLGALAMQNVLGIPLVVGIVGVMVFSGIYSIYGGLKAVAWTDVIQVVFLIGGGLVTTYLALNAVGGQDGIIDGFKTVYGHATGHFNMILERGDLPVPDGEGGMKDAFLDLPGLAVLLGAMWFINFGYWGFNQYIIQKGLAAKSLKEAKRGLIFAGYLKILIPLVVLIPGITAFVLVNDYSVAELAAMTGIPEGQILPIEKSDEAYPWLLRNFVPIGIRGLAFAALAAAVISSLASMINSTSTIFTIDIYQSFIKKDASNKELVRVGRWVALIALVIAMLIAPALSTLDQVFQYIQKFTGYIYPGVFVVYFIGLFWKEATARAAIWVAVITIPLSGAFEYILFPEMPFILRMGYVFIILCSVAFILSMTDNKHKVPTTVDKTAKPKLGYFLVGLGVALAIVGAIWSGPLYHLGFESIFVLATMSLLIGAIIITNTKKTIMHPRAITVDPEIYKTGTSFNIGAIGIVVIVGLIYVFFW